MNDGYLPWMTLQLRVPYRLDKFNELVESQAEYLPVLQQDLRESWLDLTLKVDSSHVFGKLVTHTQVRLRFTCMYSRLWPEIGFSGLTTETLFLSVFFKLSKNRGTKLL